VCAGRNDDNEYYDDSESDGDIEAMTEEQKMMRMLGNTHIYIS
jgi:hypothetical protein